MSYRNNTYYWKCDRPSAFHGINEKVDPINVQAILKYLKTLLEDKFLSRDFLVQFGAGQGNHITFKVDFKGEKYFVRLENGPEKDNYIDVESEIIETVKSFGVPSVDIFYHDASYTEVPFAYQIMEFMPFPDLNSVFKSGKLNLKEKAYQIGQYITKWQKIKPEGFGPFDPNHLKKYGILKGFHSNYKYYFNLNLTNHLSFLVERSFLNSEKANEIFQIIEKNNSYLDLDFGCLVHKDLALWNILGTVDEIKAFIDWDDAIVGDPTDDISLIACFHSEDIVQECVDGYMSMENLPENFHQRFYLHLLRNMLVKAVIRVGADYFNKKDDFFLIESEVSEGTLEKMTRDRIDLAINRLKEKSKVILF